MSISPLDAGYDKSIYKTEWWYKFSDGTDFWLLLRVDDESTTDEIEAEMEYWYEMRRAAHEDDAKAIMAAIRWMTGILASKDS